MAQLKVQPIYSDVLTGFGLDTNAPVLAFDVAAIENNISNILNTFVGTYPWARAAGANILPLVFDQITEDLATKVRMFLLQALAKYEPRIRLYPQYTQVKVNHLGDGLDIVLPYTIPALSYNGVWGAALVR